MLARLPIYPLCLLVGALLAVVAGVLHPDLVGDGAAQLTTIAQCAGWRAIHWTFLFGFHWPLRARGPRARARRGSGGERCSRRCDRGYVCLRRVDGDGGVHGSAGWSLAHSFTVAEAGMTATRAVFVFDMIHPFALATQRVPVFALGLSTCLFGWGVSEGKVLPRWLGTTGLARARSRWRSRWRSRKRRRRTRPPSCFRCYGRS